MAGFGLGPCNGELRLPCSGLEQRWQMVEEEASGMAKRKRTSGRTWREKRSGMM